MSGPFGAAILTLLRIGVEWKAPFKLGFHFREVDLRETPPKQVLALAQWQARWSLDTELVERVILGNDAASRTRYQHGIHEDVVRTTLKQLGKSAEGRALRAVVR